MKENLKPCVYKQLESVKARQRTFCRTVRRVIVTGELKLFSSGGGGKPSVKSAHEVSCHRPETG